MTIRILIADDHQIVSNGLKMVLESQPGREVIAVVNSGREAVRQAKRMKPDLVIMDVAMPDLNGIDATRQVLRDQPAAKVIALSMHADKRYVSGMLTAGVRAYLLKDCAAEELDRAVEAVMGGHVYLSPSIAGVVVEQFRQPDAVAASSSQLALTTREREVLQLLAEGLTARQVAARLCVSIKTVETHRRQIMGKLDLHSIAALTKFAIREGLTSVEE